MVGSNRAVFPIILRTTRESCKNLSRRLCKFETQISLFRLTFNSIMAFNIFSSLALTALLGAPIATAQDFGAHCEQGPDRKYLLSIQEIQSESGPRHSDAIQNTGGNPSNGTGLGYVWFDNDLVKPQFGASLGDQTGHCIQVSYVRRRREQTCLLLQL